MKKYITLFYILILNLRGCCWKCCFGTREQPTNLHQDPVSEIPESYLLQPSAVGSIPKLIEPWLLRTVFNKLNDERLNTKSGLTRIMAQARQLGYEKYFKDFTEEELYKRYEEKLAKVCNTSVTVQINDEQYQQYSAIARAYPPVPLAKDDSDELSYDNYCKANKNPNVAMPSYEEWVKSRLPANSSYKAVIDTSLDLPLEYIQYLRFSGIAKPGESTKLLFMSGNPLPPKTQIIINGHVLPLECKNNAGETFEQCEILFKHTSVFMEHMPTNDPNKIFPRNNLTQFKKQPEFFTIESGPVTEAESDCNQLFDGLDPSQTYEAQELHDAFNVEKFIEITAPWLQYIDDAFKDRYFSYQIHFRDVSLRPLISNFREVLLRPLIPIKTLYWLLEVDEFESKAVNKKLQGNIVDTLYMFGYGASLIIKKKEYPKTMRVMQSEYPPLAACFPNIPESEALLIRILWHTPYLTFNGTITKD